MIRFMYAILLVALFSAGACIAPPAPAANGADTADAGTVPAQAAEAAQAGLDIETLQNAVYAGLYEEPVQLQEGRYEGEPFVEGGASRPTVTLLPDPMASGDLDGDGVEEAAVLLAEDSGGSGTFIYLAVVSRVDGAAHNVATTLLGDRVEVESLSIADGQIMVQGAGENARQTWALEGGELVLVEGEPLERATR